MPTEVLERFVKDYIDSVTSDEVVFSWQGGEPTLLGLGFFEKVVALQKKHAKRGQRVENDLQTNGTLLDDDWARFLKRNRFLVGLSIDGPREIHDHCRITKHAEPTFDQVFAAAKMLQKHGVRFNTLTCVHRYNASRPLDVYRFLRREIGSTYLQFIPIVEIKGSREHRTRGLGHGTGCRSSAIPRCHPDHPDSVVMPWSVDPDEYGHLPLQDLGRVAGPRRSARCWSTCARHWSRNTWGCTSQVCVHSEICGKGAALEHDGDVYSCDHYVYREYWLGNIRQQSLGDMVFSPRQVKFGYARNRSRCRRTVGSANFLSDCWGECPKNRLLRTPMASRGSTISARASSASSRMRCPRRKEWPFGLRATTAPA